MKNYRKSINTVIIIVILVQFFTLDLEHLSWDENSKAYTISIIGVFLLIVYNIFAKFLQKRKKESPGPKE